MWVTVAHEGQGHAHSGDPGGEIYKKDIGFTTMASIREREGPKPWAK